MNERVLPTEGFDYRRVFPWVHVFRSIRLALRIRQLLLASAGVLLATSGMHLIDSSLAEPVTRQSPDPEQESAADEEPVTDTPVTDTPVTDTEEPQDEVVPQPPFPWDADLKFRYPFLVDWGEVFGAAPSDELAEFHSGLAEPRSFLRIILSNWQVVLQPIRDILGSFETLFDPESDLREVGTALLRIAWWMLVWSLFGGAISRSAAVEFARDQSTHFWGALRFSAVRIPSYLASPLLPLGGVALLWGLCALAGLIARIGGGVGAGLLGMLWGPLLIVALLLAIVVMGLASGWPLMVATISVEGTDGFDGMSRAYNYVYERPRYYLFQIVLTLINGSFGTFCVLFMAQLTLRMALWGVSWGGGLPALGDAIEQAPAILAPPDIDWSEELERADPASADDAANGSEPDDGNAPAAIPQNSDKKKPTDGPTTWSGRFTRFWLCALATLVVAFVYSFFWSSVTVMYFLLRRSVDGNDFDEVFLGTGSEPDDLLPLVGAAAMGVDLGTIGAPPAATSLPPDNPPYPKPQ